MQIPKIIHQVWEGKTTPLPDFLCKLGKSWRDKNPDWEYVYWDKARMDSFVHEYYPFYMDIYNKFPYDVMRWDVIRYMILYKIGGLYVDFDYECSLKKQGAILSNEEMAKIFGKGTYRCCCGTGSNVPCFNVTASSEKEALYYLPDVCSSYGGREAASKRKGSVSFVLVPVSSTGTSTKDTLFSYLIFEDSHYI